MEDLLAALAVTVGAKAGFKTNSTKLLRDAASHTGLTGLTLHMVHCFLRSGIGNNWHLLQSRVVIFMSRKGFKKAAFLVDIHNAGELDVEGGPDLSLGDGLLTSAA